MALTPGGGRSPSAPPPPRATPPRDSRRPPRTNWNAALLATLRWATLIGGLVIIIDLGTLAVVQRSPGQEVLNEASIANQISNVVLFSILGAVVARETGVFYLAALAALIGSLLDVLVVATAQTMAPMPGGNPPFMDLLLSNLTLSIIPATVSGFVSSLVERMSGPRSR